MNARCKVMAETVGAMRYLPIEAELGLEFWRASGERTVARLASLVDHWLEVRAVTDPGQREYIHKAALAARHPWEL
jgi:hypothetical protein